jgi:hypothetical protein
MTLFTIKSTLLPQCSNCIRHLSAVQPDKEREEGLRIAAWIEHVSEKTEMDSFELELALTTSMNFISSFKKQAGGALKQLAEGVLFRIYETVGTMP